MLRKLLLPMLATVALAGCATDYQYRGGQGDYYYGQPQVEYRNSGPTGFYGDIGLGYGSSGFGYGFGASYFYDRFGRLVYGYPSRYYGSPYYGRGGWNSPRPRRDHDGHGHGDQDNQHGDGDNHQDRPPPWRDLGQLQPRNPDGQEYRNREVRERQDRRPRQEAYRGAPVRSQRSAAPAPAMRERRGSSPRIGGSTGGGARTRGNNERRVED